MNEQQRNFKLQKEKKLYLFFINKLLAFMYYVCNTNLNNV